MADTTFRKDDLTRAIEAIVAAGGSAPREAKLVAENLVMANLLGHDSHGVGMIPRYIDALLEGGLAANQHPKATLDAGALLALDGCLGYGQVIGQEAMVMAIERAKKHGSCVMTLGRSHHLGRIGQWGEQAVAAGLISIHFVNVISRAIVAPHGGADAHPPRRAASRPALARRRGGRRPPPWPPSSRSPPTSRPARRRTGRAR